MKKSKWITMAAVMTFSASLAFAAPHPGDGQGRGRAGRHGRGGELGQRFVAKLNLTDAQQQQIRTINESFKARHEAFFQSSKATREQVRAARKANDTAKLESLKPAMEAQRAQFKQIREAKMQQILAVLTPEQKAQFESMKAQRMERRGGRHGKRHAE
jgi:Spy/CpxP family protein refolding chaperone